MTTDNTIQRIREVLARDHYPENKLETIAEIIGNQKKCKAHLILAPCIKDGKLNPDKICPGEPCQV